MTSFWKRFDTLPPILIRLLATDRTRRKRAMTAADIAHRSGLPVHQVDYLSQFTSWEGIDVPTARKFLHGCNIDFTNYKDMQRVAEYLGAKAGRTAQWRHLRSTREWRTLYEPMMIRYLRSMKGIK